MKSTNKALAIALLCGTAAAAAPAAAQITRYNKKPAAEAPAEGKPAPKPANQALIDLQAAVNANDQAGFPAKLAAAQAVATTPADRYFVAGLQYQMAKSRNDYPGVIAALEAMIASGGAPQADLASLQLNLAKAYQLNKQAGQSAGALEKAIAVDAANTDATVALAELRNREGRTQEAVALLQKAIATVSAKGAKPQESWYKRATGLAFKAKLPSAIALSRDWLRAYPSKDSWHDALVIYRGQTSLDDTTLLDVLRLERAAGVLSGEATYQRYAYDALTQGYPGEAKAVLDEGIAANAISPVNPAVKQLAGAIADHRGMSRDALPALATEALAAPAARLAMRTADAYYGYGDYAKAAELYRAALTKSGADANVANLRLGMALARAGDKAGATAALNAVGGSRAELAKYWLIYLATRA